MSGLLSPLGGAGWQFFNTTGGVLNGGLLYTYAAGTTTPLTTYTDSTLATPNNNPVVLSASGRPMNPSGGVGEIWLANNTAYKFSLTDANNVVQGTYDNVTGINSSTTVISEWVSTNLVPTYISGTQFSVPGNLTSIFTVNRRVQYSINAGTYYGYVSASSYSNPNTTVTIVADSTGLDSSLSAVNYGFQNSTNPSVPQNYAQTATVAANLAGRNKILNGAMRQAQRATTYALTTTAALGSIDAWSALQAGAASGVFNQVTAASQASAGSGFQYLAQLGRTNGSANTGLISAVHALASADSIPLAGQTVTLSIYAKAGANFSAAGNTLALKLVSGTGSDQSAASLVAGTWTAQTTQIANSQAITATLTRYSTTVTLPTTVTQLGVLVAYTPVGTAGADDNVYFTGVQLEPSTYVTQFELDPASVEFIKCSGRYQVVLTNSGSGGSFVVGLCYSALGAQFSVPILYPMRATPTVAVAAAATFSCSKSDLTNAGGSVSNTAVQAGAVVFQVSNATGLVAGNATMLRLGTTGVISLTADL